MSRARAAADREEADIYQTPHALSEAICRRLHDVATGGSPGYIIEPSAGSGSFVRASRVQWPHARIVAVEPYDRGDLMDAGADVVLRSEWESFQEPVPREFGNCLIVGNPPYRKALEHIEHGLHKLHFGDFLAFLLRLNFLGSKRRLDLWARPGLLSVSPIVPRPSFVGTGSDATEYALFVWLKGYDDEPAVGQPITWKKKRRCAE